MAAHAVAPGTLPLRGASVRNPGPSLGVVCASGIALASPLFSPDHEGGDGTGNGCDAHCNMEIGSLRRLRSAMDHRILLEKYR